MAIVSKGWATPKACRNYQELEAEKKYLIEKLARIEATPFGSGNYQLRLCNRLEKVHAELNEGNFVDTQLQRLTFPPYNEEDLIDWDVVVDMEKPPYRSREIIQAKLVDKGRLKPIPVEE